MHIKTHSLQKWAKHNHESDSRLSRKHCLHILSLVAFSPTYNLAQRCQVLKAQTYGARIFVVPVLEDSLFPQRTPPGIFLRHVQPGFLAFLERQILLKLFYL